MPFIGHVQRSAELTVSASIIAGFFGNGTYAERTPQPARGHRPEYKARVFHKAFQSAIICKKPARVQQNTLKTGGPQTFCFSPPLKLTYDVMQ